MTFRIRQLRSTCVLIKNIVHYIRQIEHAHVYVGLEKGAQGMRLHITDHPGILLHMIAHPVPFFGAVCAAVIIVIIITSIWRTARRLLLPHGHFHRPLGL
jgi:hypothetical protein